MTKINQLTRGQKRRLMYVENKDGLIDGADARIGWVRFSKSGQAIYYRGRTLMKWNRFSSNFADTETGEGYWISGVKKRGSNTHYAYPVTVEIDNDARHEYQKLMT